MGPVSRISRWVAFAGLVAASGLIAWVARNSSADNSTPPPLAVIPIAPPAPQEQRIPIPNPPAYEIVELAQAPAEPPTTQSEPDLTNPPIQPTKADVLVPVPTQLLAQIIRTPACNCRFGDHSLLRSQVG
jgi:hypothetical protein